MSTIRLLWIFLVILIFGAILVYLLQQREKIKKLYVTDSKRQPIQEGLALASVTAAQTNELALMRVSDSGPGIKTYNVQAIGDMPLRELCIKASYNSACSGAYMSLDALKYLLSRGGRFLDFELYYMNQTVVVAYSDDGVTILSKNTLPLTDVFDCIIANGFSAPSPNLGDPLFVQLRIRTTDPEAYTEIANTVADHLAMRLYKGSVDSNTMISAIMGKVILVVDAQISQDYALYPVCSQGTTNCHNMGTMVNMQSNAYPLYKYSSKTLMNMLSNPPTMMDKTKSDVKVLRMVEPANSLETTNPNSNLLVKNYGAQIIENRFYLKDAYLTTYEKFFSDNGAAFVPFYKAIPYLNSLS
jgi:hypothetical protein